MVGLDIGERRIGVAVSDPSCTLARPLGTMPVAGVDAEAVTAAVREISRLAAEEDGVSAVVVGLPRRLDGSPNDLTPRVQRFAADLASRIELPVLFQDERLSSHEADARLAVRQKDWRARKKQLDAAAAAVILQDYLDARAAVPSAGAPEF